MKYTRLLRSLLIGVVLISFWTAPSFAAIAFVQAAQNRVAGASATTITCNLTSTVNNHLVIIVSEGTDDTSTITVSDSAAQSWTPTPAGYLSVNTTNRGAMFYMPNSAAVTTITATYSASVDERSCVVFEFSGVATTNSLDISTNMLNAAGTSSSSGQFTTTNPNDVIVSCSRASADQTGAFFTAGGSYTIPANGENVRIGCEYLVVSSIQTGQTTSMTNSVSAAQLTFLSAFKAAAGSVQGCYLRENNTDFYLRENNTDFYAREGGDGGLCTAGGGPVPAGYKLQKYERFYAD